MRKAGKGIQFRKLPLCVAMLGCLYGGNAFAQEAQKGDQDEQKQEEAKKDDAKTLETVKVTGSLLKRLE